MAYQFGRGKSYGKANESKGPPKKPTFAPKATGKLNAWTGPTAGMRSAARGRLLPTSAKAKSSPLNPNQAVVTKQTLVAQQLEPSEPEQVVDGKGFNFLGLPGELRNKVYDHLIPARHFKIEWLTRGKDLTYSLPYDKTWKRTIQPVASIKREGRHLQRRLHSNPVPELRIPTGPAALLHVCRQIYVDTCGLFYSKNNFEIGSIKILRKFVSSLTPEAKTSVKTLFLRHGTYGDPALTEFVKYKLIHDYKWNEVCQMIAAELSNLEAFHIRLQINDLPLRLNLEAEWAKPLLAFRGRNLKTVKVVLRYPRDGCDDRLESCAGVVRRELLGAEYREEPKEKKTSSNDKVVLPKATRCLIIT